MDLNWSRPGKKRATSIRETSPAFNLMSASPARHLRQVAAVSALARSPQSLGQALPTPSPGSPANGSNREYAGFVSIAKDEPPDLAWLVSIENTGSPTT
jgi:hypothetical protein